ncbi:hypothetical protein B23_3754 [Geobacillus thermoleovorans B23]|nr:hypothetical protein B23_3754 [Geobacillus thermoleovorans B23]
MSNFHPASNIVISFAAKTAFLYEFIVRQSGRHDKPKTRDPKPKTEPSTFDENHHIFSFFLAPFLCIIPVRR